MNQFQKRIELILEWMTEAGIELAMFDNTAGKKDSSVRWLTGHPGDALLFLSKSKKVMLVPWDINLAKAYARADIIVPYNDFDRIPLKAIHGAVDKLKVPFGSKIEIPPATSYPSFLDFVGELPDFDIICREKSTNTYANRRRVNKDADEIAIIKKTADITNKIIDLLEKRIRAGKIKTEADAAIFIELESRKRGCDGTGFETLAAGPERSFGIHAYPSWTAAAFGGQGLSILDFGLCYGGYNTDVTFTFVRDPGPQQLKMINLVEKAVKLAVEMFANGNETMLIAMAVEELFAKSKKKMVHSLGHGLGLDVHEHPYIKNNPEENWKLTPGTFFSLEPGLYDPIHGGCRLENNYLITETGCEKLTEARIIHL